MVDRLTAAELGLPPEADSSVDVAPRARRSDPHAGYWLGSAIGEIDALRGLLGAARARYQAAEAEVERLSLRIRELEEEIRWRRRETDF